MPRRHSDDPPGSERGPPPRPQRRGAAWQRMPGVETGGPRDGRVHLTPVCINGHPYVHRRETGFAGQFRGLIHGWLSCSMCDPPTRFFFRVVVRKINGHPVPVLKHYEITADEQSLLDRTDWYDADPIRILRHLGYPDDEL